MAGTTNKAFLIYKEQNTNGDGTTWTNVAPTEPGAVNPFELDPSPFYTISKQITPYYENEVLKHNTEYSMTLTGFIVNTGDIFVDGQNVDTQCDYIHYFTNKQSGIFSAFHTDDKQRIKVDLQSVIGDFAGVARWTFYPQVNSIEFDSENYVNKVGYTINLTFYDLLSGGAANTVNPVRSVEESIEISSEPGFLYIYEADTNVANSRFLEGTQTNRDNVDFLEGDSYKITVNKSYNIRPGYSPKHARKYVSDNDPDLTLVPTVFVSGTNVLQTSEVQGGSAMSQNKFNREGIWFNPTVSESFDSAGQKYTRSITWTYAPSAAFALFKGNGNFSESESSAVSTVTIDGTLYPVVPFIYTAAQDGRNQMQQPIYTNTSYPSSSPAGTNLKNALNSITNNFRFDHHSVFYKLARDYVYRRKSNRNLLNVRPVSASYGTNLTNTEISVNLTYNDKKYFFNTEAVKSETISVSDTNPGDIFSVIPVIGRATGPILQAAYGRTEYQRTLQVDLVLASGYNGTAKPSRVEPTKTFLNQIIGIYSPAGEYGIRKYFVAPKTENYNFQEGTYSMSISWTYELSE